jgi:DNA-binding response OmpR family regulator
LRKERRRLMPISGTRRKVRPAVLVADGDESVRELFVAYLSHSGFDAIGTTLAAEAVAALETGSAAAVVLDLELDGARYRRSGAA